MNYYSRVRSGFTLVELMAVVAIIGILAALAIGSVSAAQVRKRDAQRKADLNLLAQAIDLYYAENRTYPAPRTGCTAESTASTWIPGLTQRYLASVNNDILPKDPKSGRVYTYKNNLKCIELGLSQAEGATTSYTLEARLENSNDPEGPTYKVVR